LITQEQSEIINPLLFWIDAEGKAMAMRSHTNKKSTKDSGATTVQASLKSRPFAPPAKPDPSRTLADLQDQLEHARRYGHSLANYSLSPSPSAPPMIQPKLTIGAPGDKYEQEADRVAKQVVQQLNVPKFGRSQSDEHEELQMQPLANRIQRVDMPEEEDELQMKPIRMQASNRVMPASEELESAIDQAKGSGQPLEDTLRQPLEQAFGADFSRVRVHTDKQADHLNRSIQARAFTTGQDVFFRQGAYQPQSRGGQELLAHELTHVLQQNGLGKVEKEESGIETKHSDFERKSKIEVNRYEFHEARVQRRDTKTGVSMKIAKNVFKNFVKGDPPFKPQKGEYGKLSWFAGENKPYIGQKALQADVLIDVQTTVEPTLNKIIFNDTLNDWDPSGFRRKDTKQHRNFWEALGKNLEGSGLTEVFIPKGDLNYQEAGTFIVADIGARGLVRLRNPEKLATDVGETGKTPEELEGRVRADKYAQKGKTFVMKVYNVPVDVNTKGDKKEAAQTKVNNVLPKVFAKPQSLSLETTLEEKPESKSQGGKISFAEALKANLEHYTVRVTLTYNTYWQARQNTKNLAKNLENVKPSFGTWTIEKGKNWGDKAIRSYSAYY
jgi:Domain of unknown function (DUF4157)